MKTRQIKYYLTVADELNFSRASEKLHIEASALSRVIGDLEAYFGVPFLHRRKGRIRLTLAGQVFREEARHILSCVESVKQKVISANKGFRSQLRIGVTDGLVQPRIARLLARCREEEPQTAIRIATMNVRQMLNALDHEHLDAAFTLDGEATGSFAREFAWTERPAVVLPIRHPLLDRQTIFLRDIKPYSFLVCHPETWSGGHYLLRKWFAETSSSLPREAVTASGHDTLMMLVGAGYGLGVCLESRALTQPHPDVIFRPLGDSVSSAEILLVFKGNSPSPELQRFIERVRRTVDQPAE